MCHILVLGSQQSTDGKLSALYPDIGCLVHRLERHHPAIGTRHHPALITWRFDRPSAWFELAVEKLVEGFERVEGVEDFVDRQTVESDEGGDIRGGSW